MKKSIIRQMMMLAVAVAAVSCIKMDGIPEGDPSKNGANGTLVFSELGVSEDLREQAHNTRAGVSPDAFNVCISSTQNGREHLNCAYSEIVSPLVLPVGNYIIKVQSHETADAEWESICYSVSKTFDIERDQTTVLDDLVCKVSNILVSVRFSDSMRDIMGGDCVIEVEIGNCGPLSYDVNELRRGAFKAEQELNTLVWEFKGTLDGSYYNETSFFKNVKAGEHRTLNFDVEKTPDPNADEGDVKFIFTVSAECDTYDVNLNVDVTEDVIEPLDPAVVITSTHSLSQRNTLMLTESLNGHVPSVDLGMNIAAAEGITSLVMELVTDNETLAGAIAAQGITGAFDLVSPGVLEGMLQGLGLPTGAAVSGKTLLDLDLAGILPLVFSFGNTDQLDIRVWVRDGDMNTDSRTLRLKLVDDSEPVTISITGDGFDIDQRMQILKSEAASAAVKVLIDVPEGISSLVVDITTDNLGFYDALKEFKFLGGFDIVAPGELEAPLRGLGLPCCEEVENKTYLEFDISGFVPMIAIFDDTVADFGMTVTDNRGNSVTKAIMLQIIKDID